MNWNPRYGIGIRVMLITLLFCFLVMGTKEESEGKAKNDEKTLNDMRESQDIIELFEKFVKKSMKDGNTQLGTKTSENLVLREMMFQLTTSTKLSYWLAPYVSGSLETVSMRFEIFPKDTSLLQAVLEENAEKWQLEKRKETENFLAIDNDKNYTNYTVESKAKMYHKYSEIDGEKKWTINVPQQTTILELSLCTAYDVDILFTQKHIDTVSLQFQFGRAHIILKNDNIFTVGLLEVNLHAFGNGPLTLPPSVSILEITIGCFYKLTHDLFRGEENKLQQIKDKFIVKGEHIGGCIVSDLNLSQLKAEDIMFQNLQIGAESIKWPVTNKKTIKFDSIRFSSPFDLSKMKSVETLEFKNMAMGLLENELVIIQNCKFPQEIGKLVFDEISAKNIIASVMPENFSLKVKTILIIKNTDTEQYSSNESQKLCKLLFGDSSDKELQCNEIEALKNKVLKEIEKYDGQKYFVFAREKKKKRKRENFEDTIKD